MKIAQINVIPSNIFIDLVKCENLKIVNYTHMISCETLYGICEVPILYHSEGYDVYISQDFHEVFKLNDIPKLIGYVADMAFSRINPEKFELIIRFIVGNVGVKAVSRWEKAINKWNSAHKAKL